MFKILPEIVYSYYDNPNICKNCGNVINLNGRKVEDVRKKNFCDKNCELEFKNKNNPIENMTKKDIFLKMEYHKARNIVRKHAYRAYKKSGLPQKCDICGYDLHIDVCHKKSVSEFHGDAKIKEINAIDNLVALCPNHHREFDSTKNELL